MEQTGSALMHYHEFRAMSTSVLLAAEGSAEAVETGFQEARAFVSSAEKRFTRFSEDSELAQLNQSTGRWFQASPEMYELMSLALQLHEQTGGLFDPGILEALEQAGYNRGIEELRLYGAPVGAPVIAVPHAARFNSLRLDPLHKRIHLPDGLRIDLGGIAKGWIAGQAAQILSRWTGACAVDAGGDVFLHGLPRGEKIWRVALEDPRDPSRTLAVLKLPPGAVATSTTTRRRWQQGGQERHHLIDPRTHLPAQSSWQSVTAIAPTATEAEVYAKALLIAGPKGLKRITRLEAGVEFIAVDQHGKLWGSKHTREYLDA